MAEEKNVATLLAEKGKKYDETRQCISSYQGSIVFLPRDVEPGQIVRVELTPVGEKRDARGKTMYQANHAWFDLGKSVRRAVAHEAGILRSCSLFGEQEALALLTARFGQVIEPWKGYTSYYFHPLGAVYASRFTPSSLLFFEAFDHAPVKGLVEPLLWIIGGVKPVAGDLYSLRQEGRGIEWTFDVPQLTDEAIAEIAARVEKGELLLSAPLVEVNADGSFSAARWDEYVWRNANFPDLFVPDFAVDPTAEVPPLAEFGYGRDINGRGLTGYGVVTATAGWSRTTFSGIWMQEKERAEAEREKTIAALIKFREQLEADRLRAAEEACRKEVEETERLRAEAEAVRKAKEAERMAGEVVAGRALADFSAFIHASGVRGDGGGYVIRPDGSLRKHDRDEYSGRNGRGSHTQHWDYVYPNEVAVTWTGFRDRAERDGTIDKLPADGLTPEQREMLNRLGRERECDWVSTNGMRLSAVPDRAVRMSRSPRPVRETKQDYWGTSEAPRRADRADQIDPNNPFAKLVALKDRLGKQK